MSEGEAKNQSPSDVFELLCEQKNKDVRWMTMELSDDSKSVVLVSIKKNKNKNKKNK
jgi:predicted CopG family antitoxin